MAYTSSLPLTLEQRRRAARKEVADLRLQSAWDDALADTIGHGIRQPLRDAARARPWLDDLELLRLAVADLGVSDRGDTLQPGQLLVPLTRLPLGRDPRTGDAVALGAPQWLSTRPERPFETHHRPVVQVPAVERTVVVDAPVGPRTWSAGWGRTTRCSSWPSPPWSGPVSWSPARSRCPPGASPTPPGPCARSPATTDPPVPPSVSR